MEGRCRSDCNASVVVVFQLMHARYKGRMPPPVKAGSSPSSNLVLKFGHIAVLAFWLAVMGAVYAGMSFYMKPKPTVVTADGDLKIPRARDGHFYVEGRVNGRPITFLVDTGASSVFVSEAFARDAGLGAGEPATFNTANGALSGRIVKEVEVSAGPLSVSSVRVGVGMAGAPKDRGLLGQNFLRHFGISITDRELVLRRAQ
jgi:aspartyl protease family protein